MRHRKRQMFVLVVLTAAVWYTVQSTPEQTNTAQSALSASETKSDDPTMAAPPSAVLTSGLANEQLTLPTQASQPRSEPANNPIARIRAIQEKTALHKSILEDHEHHTRYPSYNRRFESNSSDPTLAHYGIDERVTLSDDQSHALKVYSGQKYYLPSQQVVVSAKLMDAYGKALPAQLQAQLIYNENINLGFIDFVDQNNNFSYQARIDLNDVEGQAMPPGLYKVLIVENTSELLDAVAFVVSEPVISATGEFRESLTPEANLRIEVEVEVREAHRFYVQASLYSSSNAPIGTTQFSDALQAGRHWIPLDFHGLMIHDNEEPGPFRLKHLSLAKVGVPMERIPLISPEFETDSYALDQLNTARYEDTL